MPTLHELQKQFMAALSGHPDEFIHQVAQQGNVSRERRVQIYTNAYRIRLRECIDVDHPILGRYLGDELFEELVSGYINAYPSTYTSLRQYADHLPQYLQQHEPFKDFPILSELARFERILLFVFDAADFKRTIINDLKNIPAEKWPDIKIRLHPGVQLFISHWNVVESWQAIKHQQTPPDPIQGEDSAWLLWRNREQLTEFRSLTKSEHSMIDCVLNGDRFSNICESMLDFFPEQKVSEKTLEYLKNWIHAGIIAELIA